jgi:hypothetical protein
MQNAVLLIYRMMPMTLGFGWMNDQLWRHWNESLF